MHWCIQVNWNGNWVTVDQGYKTQDDAEWATGKWKNANKCFGDPFRAVELSESQIALINITADTSKPEVYGLTNFPQRTTAEIVEELPVGEPLTLKKRLQNIPDLPQDLVTKACRICGNAVVTTPDVQMPVCGVHKNKDDR